jgi:hypothetical protein
MVCARQRARYPIADSGMRIGKGRPETNKPEIRVGKSKWTVEFRSGYPSPRSPMHPPPQPIPPTVRLHPRRWTTSEEKVGSVPRFIADSCQGHRAAFLCVIEEHTGSVPRLAHQPLALLVSAALDLPRLRGIVWLRLATPGAPGRIPTFRRARYVRFNTMLLFSSSVILQSGGRSVAASQRQSTILLARRM